ncbi:LamG-like jellyroll fold domain-containing protein [Polaribacter aquimarinus]|uniref:Uncharacterized protein n=2 Tax=Polaribacter TaxID=52959 RepID=A0A2U2JC87_9FLAO|nr:LamG-like jellyroll fold domain-containing protein [Polaribacter aquimarinus]PWG05953.1 hypothetical protein DIS07_05805 [Polaribacter aquimarinus]
MKLKNLLLLSFIMLSISIKAQTIGQDVYSVASGTLGISDFKVDKNDQVYFVYSAGIGSYAIAKHNRYTVTQISTQGLPSIPHEQGKISLDIDSNDNLFIAIPTSVNEISVYKKGLIWELITKVTSSSTNTLRTLKLVVNNANELYLAYFKEGNSISDIVKIDTVNNTYQTIGNSNLTHPNNFNASFKFDGNNTPYLSYVENGPFGVTKVLRFNGTSWVELSGLAGFGNNAVISFNSSNNPIICFDPISSLSVNVYTSSWSSVGSISGNTDDYNGLKIAVDNSDHIYVAYSDKDNSKKIRVKKYNGSSWSIVGNGFFSSGSAIIRHLFISSSNDVYIAFDEGTNSKIRRFKQSPNVSNSSATNITLSASTLPASISEPNGATTTARGFVFSSSNQFPIIGGTNVTQVASGSGSGSFSETITGLSENTTYYYRAYGTNVEGTDYGQVLSFSTLSSTPVIDNIAPLVLNSSATLGGNITNQGAAVVTQRGIVYSATNTNPEIGGTNVTQKTSGSGTGIFSERITGLTENTLYYYKAYATNSNGTTYTPIKTFTTKNNALHFDGTDDSFFVNYNNVFDVTNEFSIDFWVNPATSATTLNFFRKGEAIKCFIYSTNKLFFSIRTVNSSYASVTTSESLSRNVWSHVAFVKENSSLNVYINGVKATVSTSGSVANVINDQSNFEIGDIQNPFSGAIDEFRFWNKALSVNEINFFKDGKVNPTTSGLLLYFPFDQGVANGNNTSITSLIDVSSNQLTGNLVNFAKTGTSSNFINGNSGSFSNSNLRTIFNATSNNNWSIANNWSSSSLPNIDEDIFVPSNITLNIDVDDASINGLNLSGTLNINSGKALTTQDNFITTGTATITSTGNDSGSLLVKGTSTGNVTYERGGLLANNWHIITAPVSGQSIKAFVENTNNNIRVNTSVTPNRYAVGYYDDSKASGSKWVYYTATDLTDDSIKFEKGSSYAISRASDGSVSFTGTLEVNTIDKTVTGSQWNAIGNSFTTFYPVNKNSNNNFLADNTAKLETPAIYIWDKTQQKYVAVTNLVSSTEQFIPPGQGFFIKPNANTTLQFDNNKRSIQPSSGTHIFNKSQSSTPFVKLFIDNGTVKVNTDVIYSSTATTGFDANEDIENFSNSEFDINSHLVANSNGKNYTIQSLPNTNIDNYVIPISIDAKANNQIVFSASLTNLEENYNVYLEDREAKKITNLKDENSNYTITPLNHLSGIGRFYLHTTQNVLRIGDNVISDPLEIFVSSSNVMHVNGLKHEETKLKMYNIIGGKILTLNYNGIKTGIKNVNHLKTGLYVISLRTPTRTLNKKIFIE